MDMHVRTLNILNQGRFFILESVIFCFRDLVSLIVDITTSKVNQQLATIEEAHSQSEAQLAPEGFATVFCTSEMSVVIYD
jgi:hypothetical protein